MSSYHYSLYSPHGLHCLGFLPQISLLVEYILPQISQIYTELLAEYILPRISQIYTELLAECIPPQISQIYTELLAECILPRNPQNPQNCLLSVFSHRFTQKLGCLQGGVSKLTNRTPQRGKST